MSELFTNYGELFLQGTLDTLFMTFVATLFAYIIGLPLGVLLTITKKGSIAPAPTFNAVFGWVINILRSLPFMILMIFVMPLTRIIIGSSIGTVAATVPLIIAAFPFVARMVETSFEEVDHGVIEAARCMGANNFQIVSRVLLVESVPSLLRGLSISTITILGYTAITGALGAGGLGDIAVRYGFHRYKPEVMYATIVLLIILVCIIQGFCNLASRTSDKRNR